MDRILRAISNSIQVKDKEFEYFDYLIDNYNIEKTKLQHSIQSKIGCIAVGCRIRPTFKEETEATFALSDQQVVVKDNVHGLCKDFQFSFVYGPKDGHIYQEIMPLVHSACQGRQCCIFAYGQTNAGKSYTMSGNDKQVKGVYQLAAGTIFEQKSPKAMVKMSMVEIYNEDIMDLLNHRSSIDLRHAMHGVEMKNVTEIQLRDEQHTMEVLQLGNAARCTAKTGSNDRSSRSHSIVLLTIYEKHKMGKLVLVDLAGSERISKTKATGSRLKEAQCINKSLSALGDVMFALQAKQKHVPYRNSKLTHVLQESLSKNSNLMMLVHVNPGHLDIKETLCSLGFATRVSKIELGVSKKRNAAQYLDHVQTVEQLDKQITKLQKVYQEESQRTKRMQSQLDAQLTNLQKVAQLHEHNSR